MKTATIFELLEEAVKDQKWIDKHGDPSLETCVSIEAIGEDYDGGN